MSDRSALAAEILRWLAQRPQLFHDAPTSNLTVCGSCGQAPRALVTLGSPSGAYALCSICLGADGVPRPALPAAIPPKR